MDNDTEVYLQSIVSGYVIEEEMFTMADLIECFHSKWRQEQLGKYGKLM